MSCCPVKTVKNISIIVTDVIDGNDALDVRIDQLWIHAL